MVVVLAQMWDRDDHMGGGWWWVMGIGWLLFLAFLGFLAYLLVRHFTESRGAQPPRSSAEELLAERLARGEIDEDEYRSRRDALRG
ncbi:MAG: SHOCT domain-containing protein [Acidimicrobiia bacterium]|jgi:putative membrane protein